MRDMFGNELSVGLYVIFADYTDDGQSTRLNLYCIQELRDDVVVGRRMNGRWQDIGDDYYLTNPSERIAVVGGEQNVYGCAAYYEDTTKH